jgi:ribosomal protection tetracycline resistance protein
MRPVLLSSARRAELFPVLFGASGRGIGVEALLDAIVEWLPPPEGDERAAASGVVFKLDKDPAMGRVAYVRLYNGAIRNRDTVLNATRGLEEKVTQIRRIAGRRTEDTGLLRAGDIAALYGLGRARIGDILGSPDGVPGGWPKLAVPLLTVQARWRNEADYPAVVAAFQELADEDPLLGLEWLQEERELHLKVMGTVQMEVLSRLVRSRFGLDVSFGPPSVIYKETPAKAGEGYIAYTMPKPCWAILRFRIEPGERGSGLKYASTVRPEDLLDSYQNEVARRVPEALEQGLFGWEVTDLKVTLIEGEHHVWHTHPLDFVVATPMGIMNGLAATGTKLLEPMLRFRLTVPEEFGGKIMGELAAMRGEFDPPAVSGERMELEGTLPVATSLDFPARLGSLTKGRGTLSTFYAGYRECPPEVRAERPRRGVNPLDQAKYILAARSALSRE